MRRRRVAPCSPARMSPKQPAPTPRNCSRCCDSVRSVPKDTPGRIATLDGLRAISILIVFAAHVGGTRNAPFKPLGFFADFGVRTFFIISGFLITTLLLRERTKTGAISLRSFYVRRVFRIFPAF